MKKNTLAVAALVLTSVVRADPISSFVGDAAERSPVQTMTVTADRIAADRNTEALFATGHVVAAQAPIRLHSDFLERDTNGVCRMAADSSLTTCTNCPGHLHWEIKGEVEYQADDHVLLRDAWLRFCEVPVFWLPYFYYPLGTGFGVEIMPGYTSRWGAYLLTKCNYTLIGDPKTGPDGRWLYGDTRLDLRWENGIAVGESLKWSLGNWGQGRFKVYYAWDQDYDRYGGATVPNGYNAMNWGSTVPYNRYGIELEHRVDVTERDVVRGKVSLFSDMFFSHDFMRQSMFGIKNDLYGYPGNEVAWEHTENLWGLGVSVSGPLEDFRTAVARLPEVYFDLAPTPLWNLPINYETQNRLGFLSRQRANYDGSSLPEFAYNPGQWADYDTVRFDTYHRLSASFRAWDVLAIVPRVGYHGTYWNKTGATIVDGTGDADMERDNAFRSIVEAGVTFSGRGTAWISESWQHMIEPYADVLLQEAWCSGLSDGRRPLVFDSIDASSDWSDQFAGRSRNLPYSWYGVTPGLRNVLREADERGKLRTVFDLDVYAALQFNRTDWTAGEDSHKLSDDPLDPNYGGDGMMVVPGARVRWMPFSGAALSARLEYDSENSKIAQANLMWNHRVRRDFSYRVLFTRRDHRYWDFSSSSVSPRSDYDGFNRTDFGYVEVGFEHEPCDVFAWAPYIRWDCRRNELDEVGTWVDIYRTDCLGFRLNLAYENEYTRVEGSCEDAEWRIGFYIYLRAFGPNQGLKIGD